jgi:hypothetical protein
MKPTLPVRVPGAVLDRRALNRALLARQMLLARLNLPAEEAIERLVGLQAQSANAPYLGLWTRLAGFRQDELSRLIEERRAVRLALQRSTIHLVTARDCLALRPVVQPALDRGLQGSFGRHLVGLSATDRAALLAAGRALVEERPRTWSELGEHLAERFPGRDPEALANAIRTWAPLVQVPPRGLWGSSGPAAHTTAESWLGRPLDPAPSLEALLLRYLAAFGPATVRDMQTWSGLTRLAETVERLRPRLEIFRDENGHELFDLPDAPRPAAETPAPPRFLPEYDNLLLSHADRTRVIADAHRSAVFTQGAFLIDGFVRGTWKIARQRKSAILRILPFRKLAKKDAAALAREGERLLGFAVGEAERREVEVT